MKKMFVLLLVVCIFRFSHVSSAFEASSRAQAPSALAGENFAVHFMGHVISKIDFDTAVSVVNNLFGNGQASIWEKGLKAVGLGQKSISELLSEGLTLENIPKFFEALKDALPKEKFEAIMRDLRDCPRCGAFVGQFANAFGIVATEGSQQPNSGNSSIVAPATPNGVQLSDKDAEREGVVSHFWGHCVRVYLRLYGREGPSGIWEKVKGVGEFFYEAGKVVIRYLTDPITMAVKLWDLLPTEIFKELGRDMWDCPRCGGYVREFCEAAWEKIKAGGNWVGDKAISFKDWLWSDDKTVGKPEPEPQTPAEQKPGFWSSAWDKVGDWSSSAWQNTKKGGSWLKDKTVSAGETIGDWGSSLWQRTKKGGGWLKEKAGSAWNSVTDSISAGWNWVLN